MTANTARVLITKLGAAERQLNTAIRMFLAGDDELAVHTVAAAAYQMLRDLQRSDGEVDNPHELFLLGLFSIARDLERGERKAIPENLAVPAVIDLIESIRGGMREGRISEPEDVSVHSSKGFWKEFNESAAFLKHAKEDPDGVLDLATLKNGELLMRAAGALIKVTRRATPEIEALMNRLDERATC